MSGGTGLRLLQLTDTHIRARSGARRGGVDTRAALAAALERARAEAPDLLVLSGDLADDGRPESYLALRELLGDLRERTRLLPGNHDCRDALRAVMGLSAETRHQSFSLVAGGWRLIGLDSNVPRRIHGRLGDDQLTWLAAELQASAEPAILFVHHPPVRMGTWWLDRDRLRDAHALERVLVASGRVRAIFCGHVHQEQAVRFAGIDVHSTPSTAYQFVPGSWFPRHRREGAGYRVVELDGPTLRTRVVRLG